MPFQLRFCKKNTDKKQKNKNQGETKNLGHIWKKLST